LFIHKFNIGSAMFVDRAVHQASAFEVDRAEDGLRPFVAQPDEICQWLEVELISESASKVAGDGPASTD
jgi:hypothetical protein